MFFFVCEQCTFYPVLAMCMEINNLYLNFFYSTIIINLKKKRSCSTMNDAIIHVAEQILWQYAVKSHFQHKMVVVLSLLMFINIRFL